MESLYNKSISIPKWKWEQVAETVKTITPVVQRELMKINHEGQGTQDAYAFETDMILAYTAIMYVSEFAADKCRVVSEGDI